MREEKNRGKRRDRKGEKKGKKRGKNEKIKKHRGRIRRKIGSGTEMRKKG